MQRVPLVVGDEVAIPAHPLRQSLRDRDPGDISCLEVLVRCSISVLEQKVTTMIHRLGIQIRRATPNRDEAAFLGQGRVRESKPALGLRHRPVSGHDRQVIRPDGIILPIGSRARRRAGFHGDKVWHWGGCDGPTKHMNRRRIETRSPCRDSGHCEPRNRAADVGSCCQGVGRLRPIGRGSCCTGRLSPPVVTGAGTGPWARSMWPPDCDRRW